MYDNDTLPVGANVLRWGSSPADDDEMRAFLKRRLLVYVRLMATALALFYVAGWIVLGVTAPSLVVQVHLHPSKVLNLLAAVLLFSFWAVLRKRTLGELALRACDLGAVLALAIAVGLGTATARYRTRFRRWSNPSCQSCRSNSEFGLSQEDRHQGETC